MKLLPRAFAHWSSNVLDARARGAQALFDPMNRFPLPIAVLFLCQWAGIGRAEIFEPSLLWGPIVVGSTGGSSYYLNDSVEAGNVLGARISYGPYEQDKTGAIVNALPTSPTAATAKSSVRLGDYVYFTGDSGGVYRTQVANTATPWSTFTQCTLNEPSALETIATNGSLIFGTTTDGNDNIRAYSVDTATGDLTVSWTTTGITGRVRGLDWDASGYLYAGDGGGTTEAATNQTAHLYAIRGTDGAVTDLGQITFNGRQYQVVREGSQLAVFDSFSGTGAPAGQMYVYNLAGDTALESTTPVHTWDPAGIGRIYGAAIDDGFLWLASGSGQTYGFAIPEPHAAWLLLAAALGWAIARRRR